MALTLQVAGKTDIGLVRSNNEDNFGYDTRHGIFLVCDGMGGQAAGERASKIAVDTVLDHFRRDRNDAATQVVGRTFDGVSERANELGRAIQLANQAIHEEATLNAAQTGMGSTIVAVVVADNLFSIANVGDSRIYLLRDGKIQQLTDDHSLVMEQVRRGLMTLEEAENSKNQNVIVRSLGVEDSVEPDLQDHEFAAGDVLLLCSDGLSRFVQNDSIVEIVSRADSLEKVCDELIEAAKSAGSDDNITCMLLRVAEQSRGRRILEALLPVRNRHRWQDSV
jgi:serine/threonine protein phosphatase PrpC